MLIQKNVLLIALFIVVPFVTAVLTYVIRRYALRASLLDIPNERSSHTMPTPRGGGLAFVLVYLITLPLLDIFFNYITFYQLLALMGAGLLVVVIGFFDDRGHIAAKWRLVVHFVAAIWILFWLGGFPKLPVFGFSIPYVVASALAMFYLVWLLNLYNFMDGINGIAALEVISVCIGISALYWVVDFFPLMVLPLMLACTVLGFLVWNFPSARIFMGDAGSGFLGIMLGGLSLIGTWVSPQFFWSWLILLGVFIVDATWTLVHRLIRKQRIYEAHRSHAYQFAARYYGKHLPVSLGVLAINLFWLTPLALLVGTYTLNGLLGLVIAYIPLCYLAYTFKAGSEE